MSSASLSFRCCVFPTSHYPLQATVELGTHTLPGQTSRLQASKVEVIYNTSSSSEQVATKQGAHTHTHTKRPYQTITIFNGYLPSGWEYNEVSLLATIIMNQNPLKTSFPFHGCPKKNRSEWPPYEVFCLAEFHQGNKTLLRGTQNIQKQERNKQWHSLGCCYVAKTHKAWKKM